MLFSPVYIEAHTRRSTAFASRMNLREATPATTGQTVCTLVTLRTPTDTSIPFLFNRSSFLRPRRRPTGSYVSHLFSCPCEHFPPQQGGTPPTSLFLDGHLIRSRPFPAIHPSCFHMFTKCSSSNSFILITIHFHGGRGV